MYISAPRKKTAITDTNGVKTSRLRKPDVVGKAAIPAAALPSKRSSTLALSLAGNSEVGAEHTCLASVYWNEWPELALDLTSAKPIASAVELEFELDEFWYAAAVETILADKYGFEDAHSQVLRNRPSVRNAFTGGHEPEELAAAVNASRRK